MVQGRDVFGVPTFTKESSDSTIPNLFKDKMKTKMESEDKVFVENPERENEKRYPETEETHASDTNKAFEHNLNKQVVLVRQNHGPKL